ncbi:MAG: Holliday junction resolvase RuvX [Candidatus Promineifilaceae bacterium]|nr:Holliday junction resolvase RuvX [Candidatus Promineifilaceae bacterium]
METLGKVMALDLGEKRIGVALSDPSRTIAKSYAVLIRKSRKEDFQRYANIIAQEAIKLLVVGLPVPLSGIEGQRANWVRDYTADLRKHIEIPVEFWDESFSTKQAEASLRERGLRGKKIKERVDAVAAAFILQDYLDAHYPG